MAMASSALMLATFFAAVCIAVASSARNSYYVGGQQGWVVNPKESYNEWATKIHFKVHDYLVFKYNNQTDSVLEVRRFDYDACNSTSPHHRMTSGFSWFKLNRKGSFYFIGADHDSCVRGEKMVVFVNDSDRHHKRHNITISPPSPSAVSPPPCHQSGPVSPPPASQVRPSEGSAPSPSGQPADSSAAAKKYSRFSTAIGLAVGSVVVVAAMVI